MGSGIGLVICREMARRNGGDIRIASVLGKETEAALTVPLERALSEPAVLARGGDAPVRSITSGDAGRGGDTITAPSFEKTAVLYDLAIVGEMDRIAQQVDLLESTEPSLEPFLERVRDLLAARDEEGLQNFIEGHLETSQTPVSDPSSRPSK